jgi:hypothetical protein
MLFSKEFFIGIGVCDENATLYENLFDKHRIDKSVVALLSDQHLREIGVVAVGDRLRILVEFQKFQKQNNVNDGGSQKQLALSERIEQAVSYILRRVDAKPDSPHHSPRIAIVLGSGLGSLTTQLQHSIAIPFDDIPHFCKTSAESHAGNVLFGTLSNTAVVLLAGRNHLYEGGSIQEIAFPIRVLHGLLIV